MAKHSKEIIKIADDGSTETMLASEAAKRFGKAVYTALRFGMRMYGFQWRWADAGADAGADGRSICDAEERRQRRNEQRRLRRIRRRNVVSVGEAVAAFAELFPDPERAQHEMLAMLGMPLETIMKAAARYYMRNKCIISSDGWIEARDKFLKKEKIDGEAKTD